MLDMTLKIDGLDIQPRLSTYSVTKEVEYREVITTLDEVEHPYPRSVRPVLRFSLIPGTSAEDSILYDKLLAMICNVTFTMDGVDVTKKMRLTSSLESTFLLKSVDGKRRYLLGEIEMRGL